MKKEKSLACFIILSLIVSGILFSSHQDVFAQVAGDKSPNESESGQENLAAYIWAPKNMIKGETYDAVIVLKQGTKYGDLALIATSDPTIIQVPESVSVLPHTNHGIFQIEALKEGKADVFASIGGELVETGVTVHSASRQPKALDILIPSNVTKAENMMGYVISVDSNGSPVPVKENIQVHISSSSMIDVPQTIEIKNGTHYSKFTANIMGSGKIFASAEGLNLAEQEITKQQDPITVKVGVAPDVAMQNSKAFFYVWLEKDGKPFKPPYVTEAFLSSSDVDLVRFSENQHITHYGDSIITVPIIDGVGKGVLVTDNPGAVIITANVKGFGSAQTNMVVGSVLLDEDLEIIAPEDEEEFDRRVRLLEENTPTVAFSWFYPKVTDNKAYGVVALYNMNVTQDVVTDVNFTDTSVIVTDEINRVVPAPLDGRTVTISSASGLDYPDVLVLSESNEIAHIRGSGFNHAIEFEVNAQNQGNYTLSVSGPGLDRFQSQLDVISAYQESYSLDVLPIPALHNQHQDLAMISVLDESGALIDVEKTFSGPVKLDISTTNIDKDSTLSSNKISITNANSAVYGGLVKENAMIVVSSSGIDPIEAQIKPAGVAASIDFDVPQIAHVSEKIPYAIHEIDVFGTPLQRITTSSMSSTPGIETDGVYLVSSIEDDGKVSVLSKVGADANTIDTFANKLDLAVLTQGSQIKVGNEFQVELVSEISDVEILVDSPFPYEKIDDLKYSIIPNKEGHYNVTFTGIKEGYKTKSTSFGIFAEHIIDLVIKAIGSDGNELNIAQTISIGNVSSSAVTPYSTEIKPHFVKTAFPQQLDVGDKGYVLTKTTAADQEFSNGKVDAFLNDDATILAEYERMIKVDVKDAEGSGFYPYGQTVTLGVPPKEKTSFLIREVFDHWDGLPYGNSQPISFVANEDIHGKAVFRDDYSVLMLILGTITSVLLYFVAFKKKGISPVWYLQKIKNNLKLQIPRISKINLESLKKIPKSKKKRQFSFERKN